MIIRWMGIWILLVIATFVPRAATGGEGADAVVETSLWSDKIGSYDLAFTKRRFISQDSRGTGTEVVWSLRETYDEAGERYSVGAAEGLWRLDAKSLKGYDESMSWVSMGAEAEGFKQGLGKGRGRGKLRCPDNIHGCLKAVRPEEFSVAPLRWFVPLPTEGLNMVADTVKYFVANEKEALKSDEEMTHFGEKLKVSVYRYTREIRPKAGPAVVLGVDFAVAREGDCKGFVVRVRQGFLKPGVDVYRSDDDFSFIERSVVTAWKTYSDDHTLPVQIVRRFRQGAGISRPLEGEYCTESLTFDWKKVGSPNSELFIFEEIAKEAGKLQIRVDELLNR